MTLGRIDHVTPRRRALLAASVLCASAACGPATIPPAGSSPGNASPVNASSGVAAGLPLTRAERTGYAETSHYEDVVGFLDSLARLGGPLSFGTIGKTTEGRAIPYVIAARPRVADAAAAQATGKPIVYVQANIHAGEVEGKEALLALVRDLAFARGPNVLDSIVLVAVPDYNADGNEKWGPQERQRTEQNGPALVGQRPNAQGLDLNRDYVKAEAPETRASLAMFNLWDPDVFVDLHTTDGSFHGYALTYSPSLTPAAPLGEYTRDLLKELRARVRQRDGYETFDYGNFSDAFGAEVSTDTVHRGWYTYDHRPRFGTNYYGLRNRIAVLSEAFSHDPFERRVRSTYAFTKELLSLVAERAAEIHRREAGTASGPVALRAALPKTAPEAPVSFEVLARTGDSSRTQAGVPKGLRRTGEFRTRMMPVFDRFVPVLERPLPAEYLFSVERTDLLHQLERHGVRVSERALAPRAADEFVIDSLTRSARPFQEHNEVRVEGHWRRSELAGRFWTVRGTPLSAYLLDPESDDGFATWNAFDDVLRVGGTFPVLRIPAP